MSGGPDSTALMHAAAGWSRTRGGPPLIVATVDHGLRPQSRQEAEGVGAVAATLGLPHRILTWESGSGPVSQARAREARYALLAVHAAEQGAGRLATAHTLDDQAETVLIRLARGSGLSGLAGMRPSVRRAGLAHLRPFLGLRKDALVATCEARGWDFVRDPTNADLRHARPRWRALARTLAAEGLTPERTARLADRLRRADTALEEFTDRAAREAMRLDPEGAVHLDLAGLASWPDEITLRLLLRALRGAGRSIAPGETARTERLSPLAGRGRVGEADRAEPTRGPRPRSGKGWAAEGRGGHPEAACLDGPSSGFSDAQLDFSPRAGRSGGFRAGEGQEAAQGSAEEPGHLRLERVEAVLATLREAASSGRVLRRSLGGCVLSLDRRGGLTVSREPERRRGR